MDYISHTEQSVQIETFSLLKYMRDVFSDYNTPYPISLLTILLSLIKA